MNDLEWLEKIFSTSLSNIGMRGSYVIVEWAKKILAIDNKIKEENLVYIGNMIGEGSTYLHKSE